MQNKRTSIKNIASTTTYYSPPLARTKVILKDFIYNTKTATVIGTSLNERFKGHSPTSFPGPFQYCIAYPYTHNFTRD